MPFAAGRTSNKKSRRTCDVTAENAENAEKETELLETDKIDNPSSAFSAFSAVKGTSKVAAAPGGLEARRHAF